MTYENVIIHARSFASEIVRKLSVISGVLRKYQSKEVVDDEIERSVKTLNNLGEIKRYFSEKPLSEKTASFLPLNLPLYSLVLFGVIPSYQSTSLVLKVPGMMSDLFRELIESIGFGDFFPNIILFEGPREKFLCEHCKTSSVVIFTGRYENFLKIQKECSSTTLILYNGVGHNPVVVTPSADINLAVAKTIKVKLFNNGQDCAGPDIILVHRSVSELYTEKLLSVLSKVKCRETYSEDGTIIGPLFEKSSLIDAVHLISDMRKKGADIIYGGQVDISQNMVYPCVLKFPLSRMQNFTEIYSPIFLIAEYSSDRELDSYFDDPGNRYQNNDMYISLFGESNYVSNMDNGIILRDSVIHDVEIGTREYGGYSHGASSVCFCGLKIAKPLLIPREIFNFLSSEKQHLYTGLTSVKKHHQKEFVVSQFQSNVKRIFGEQLVFAYIFGGFANGKDKRYSDIDTFICVSEKIDDQIKMYLEWLFDFHESLGRIPDFKYPSEIVVYQDLKLAVDLFRVLELSATENQTPGYDAMVWCHSLSQPWLGEISTDKIPSSWRSLFGVHKSRLLRSFLGDLEKAILKKSPELSLNSEIYEIPRKEPEITNFINNLEGRGLVKLLKMIPFEEKTLYGEIVLKLVQGREFIGKEWSDINEVGRLYDPYFRFGATTF